MMFNRILKGIGISLLCLALPLVLTGGVFAQPTTQPTTQVLSPTDVSKQEGADRGKFFGEQDGKEAGAKDFHLGRNANPAMNTITNTLITSKYALDKDNATFRTEFLKEYKLSYEIAYYSSYRKEAYDASQLIHTQAQTHANQLAAAEGHYYASYDLVRDKSNNWSRAYNEFLTKGTLDVRYQLDRESQDYKDAFYAAFKSQFSLSYIQAFTDINALTEAQNINYHFVGMSGDEISITQVYGEVVGGTPGMASRITAALKVPRGAIYQDTYLGLHHIQNSFSAFLTGKESVTHQIRVSVANSGEKVKLYQPIELIFDYEGTERAGIYEWKYNRWLYVPTTRGENYLSASIPVGDYTGGTYAVLIDTQYKLPQDIALHWANQDIITAVKREYVPNKDFFRPSDGMTRLELADLLYRVMHYRAKAPGQTIQYADMSLVPIEYRTAVNYALDRGFLTLDANKKFNPKSLVPYRDFEVVMKRILYIDFKFSAVAEKMQYERYQRTDYTVSSKLPIKRSEAIFTFNTYIK